MKRKIQFYEDVEQLNYYIYHDGKFQLPSFWNYLDKCDDKKTGMYAEVYKSPDGEIVMIVRGTDKFSIKDYLSDAELENSKIPEQAESAFKFYNQLTEKYGKIIVSGYSLGGSLAQIIGNETGTETVTFAAYGIGDIVEPNHTEKIINFGNESDPVFQKNLDNQLGKIYVVPNSENYDVKEKYSAEESNLLPNIGKHMPGNMGDLSKAFEYTGRPFKLSASYDYYDDSILVPSNKVYYNGKWASEEMTREDYDTLFSQYFGNGDKLPEKEEMDRRVRFGELIYVEDYVRSDGTHVSGYYRRYPKD